MSWCKLQFSLDEENPINPASVVMDEVRKRDESLNHPSGVAVFTGVATARTERIFLEVYFSPAAVSLCSDILASWGAIECPAPIGSELQNFGLSYGNSASWDLLK